MEWWGTQWNFNGILRSNLVVSMGSPWWKFLRGTTEMKALKSQKRVRHAYVGNTTNGYWIWKLRTNNAPGSLLFFKLTKKTLQTTSIRQLLFGEAYHEKLRLPGPQTGWRSVCRSAFCHDTCGGKVSSGQATLECGWLWRKGAREFGAIWAVGHRSIWLG